MNIRQYSLNVLNEWTQLQKELRKRARELSEHYTVAIDDGFTIKLEAVGYQQHYFTVRISGQAVGKQTPSFDITWQPKNGTTTERESQLATSDHALQLLNIWAQTIAGYARINLTPDDIITNQYSQEFEGEFAEILDDGADTQPFDYPRQLFLYRYLTFVEQVLNAETGIVDFEPVIQEVRDLKDNLQNYTKKETVSRLSRIWGKVRKKGIRVIKKIYSEAQSAIIKELVKRGLDNVDTAFQKLIDFAT